jgi:hypothetical protein
MQIAEGTPGTLLMNLKALEAKKVPIRPHLLVAIIYFLIVVLDFPISGSAFSICPVKCGRDTQIRHLKLLRYAFHFICF